MAKTELGRAFVIRAMSFVCKYACTCVYVRENIKKLSRFNSKAANCILQLHVVYNDETLNETHNSLAELSSTHVRIRVYEVDYNRCTFYTEIFRLNT